MQQEFLTRTGINEMLGEALDSTPALSAEVRTAVSPLLSHRESLRSTLRDSGAIRELPNDGSYLSLTAVDGACAVSPLFVGDQVNVLAASVSSDLDTGDVEILGYRTINEFLPHSPATELFTKAAMFSAELSLAAEFSRDDSLVVLDGSHASALITVVEALAASGSAAYEYICSDVISDEVIRAAQRVADNESTVACPKSDSSTELSDVVESQGVKVPAKFPDKVLASLLLDPNEVLDLKSATAPWDAYDVISRHVTSSQGKEILAALTPSVERLRGSLRVAHIKPEGSPTAVRVETKSSLDDFATMDCWQAIADDCAPPHTQEPVAQYIVDHIVKNVSELAKVQLAEARADLAEGADDRLLDLLIRSYRT